MRILLVEDDAALGDGIRVGLAQSGFAVDWVTDGRAAEAALATHSYDAAVLDLGLPRLDGTAVLARLRARDDPLPVLIVTARDRIEDRVAGLDAGGDDYLVKPFDLAELVARLRALLRRAKGRTAPVIRLGEVCLDPASRNVTWAGRPVELSAREFVLLQELLTHAGHVLSRGELEEKMYGWGEEIESNAVEVFIHHLRRKLSPGLIRTIRGVGYIIPKEGA